MKQTLSILTAVFAVLVFFVSCGGSEEGKVCESCGIYGHVTDYETGEDVVHASVQLRPGGDTTLTGSDGMFEFRGLPSGDYSITVSKAGYSDLVDDFVITVRDRMVRRDVQIVNECKEGYCCATNNITPCIDKDTNITWSSRAAGEMNWESAIAYCENLSEGDFSDWTLPSVGVLLDFYDEEKHSSKLGDKGTFWSTSDGYCSDSAYCVDLSDGEAGNCCHQRDNHLVRCIR